MPTKLYDTCSFDNSLKTHLGSTNKLNEHLSQKFKTSNLGKNYSILIKKSVTFKSIKLSHYSDDKIFHFVIDIF